MAPPDREEHGDARSCRGRSGRSTARIPTDPPRQTTALHRSRAAGCSAVARDAEAAGAGQRARPTLSVSSCRRSAAITASSQTARSAASDQVDVVSTRRTSTAKPAGGAGARTRSASSTRGSRAGRAVRVRQIAREQEDGFRSQLVPGVKASAAAERLAEEIAFACARLATARRGPARTSTGRSLARGSRGGAVARVSDRLPRPARG